MSYWRMIWNGIRRQLWWKTVTYGLLGLFAALMAIGAERFLPFNIPFDISRDAVSNLLGIISSSMLAVTTFSIGAMTTAFGAASSGVTPRATMLLQEDSVTHNALSSFIGAFVFSVIGTIVLTTGSYGERGRVVLFAITIVVLGMIVVQLLRWVNHLMNFGRSSSTIQRVEAAAAAELEARLSIPYLGAHPWPAQMPPPEGARPVLAGKIGYLKFMDIAGLSTICEEVGLEIYMPCNTGTLLYEDTALAWFTGNLTSELSAQIHENFILAPIRSFEQDPRFGLIVMAEIGSRALSSATNDAGTAIEIITRLTRLLAIWSKGREDEPVTYPRLHLRPLSDADLFDDAFLIMGRDGAHLLEVQLRLQKSLAALGRMGSRHFRQAAADHARLLMIRAEASTMLPADLALLRGTIEQVDAGQRFGVAEARGQANQA
ncbi:DUF2254 domain-containing protein [Xinfangfangia sp. D13-10-4-6]|uniref:DUF2254 domain-containing protein n=1 Tax=Pseudogemmobacter hezensis TaxID=2737662 RepID=UPI001554A3F3|nr:DUF2254 domain-containing protein [Pseudogemmobacter hezensis]NPD16743.1 DUF2254 domain-containing protein [Pseudogemmobacter hezensis]